MTNSGATDLHSSSKLQDERLKEGYTFFSASNEITFTVAGSLATHDGFKAQSVLAKSVHDVTKCTIRNCSASQSTIRYSTLHCPSACPNLDNTEQWQQRVCLSACLCHSPLSQTTTDTVRKHYPFYLYSGSAVCFFWRWHRPLSAGPRESCCH